MSFEAFQLHSALVSNLQRLQFTQATPIQAQAIPAVLSQRDLIGLAQTGTGKTAAFMLPILQRLLEKPSNKIRALIVVPTRELAEQIRQVASELSRGTPIKTITIYGGVAFNPQRSNLHRGCDIVIACPGRLLDHIQQRTIDLRSVEHLVLDEADQMFDMGFLPNIRRILQHVPKNRQSLLFSATMPPEIRRLTGEILNNPQTIQIGETAPASTVAHALYPVPQHLKTELLIALLRDISHDSVLVFTRTKHRAKKVEKALQKARFEVAALHGNLSQNRRQASMQGFRSGEFQVLVATDIAARGVDISTVSHVINYDIPDTTEAYTHRIGRTGRAQKTGDAFTLVSREDEGMIRQIERVLKAKIDRKTIASFDYTQAAAPREPNREFQPQRRARPAGRPHRRGGDDVRGQRSQPSSASSSYRERSNARDWR
ncbi:MAG: DEAD/DEAH box helicase [Deltaproteobacteria bacterium]|nr:DEAD/DEAH box helicase [Deltaproteobacteria bacterium]